MIHYGKTQDRFSKPSFDAVLDEMDMLHLLSSDGAEYGGGFC